jgi:hypothetical protein
MAEPSSTSTTYGTLNATTLAFLNSCADAVAQQDPKLLLSTLSSNCRRHISPASFLVAQGHPADAFMSNEEYLAFVTPNVSVFASHRFEAHQVLVDEGARSAMAWVTEYSSLREKEGAEKGMAFVQEKGMDPWVQ